MPTLIFVQPDGTRQSVVAREGASIMEAARDNKVFGVRAECGGECACSTCHCYIDDEWLPRLPPKGAEEAGMVDFVWEPKVNSRLTCQVVVTGALNGLVVHVPERQL